MDLLLFVSCVLEVKCFVSCRLERLDFAVDALVAPALKNVTIYIKDTIHFVYETNKAFFEDVFSSPITLTA